MSSSIRIAVLCNPANTPIPYTHTWYTIGRWMKSLAHHGFEFKFFRREEKLSRAGCDVLLVGNQAFNRRLVMEKRLDALERFRKYCQKLVFFDTTASCGTTKFEVLPFVDRYWKKQLYRDRKLYSRHIYSSRNYCEFYHRNFGITDNLDQQWTLLPEEHSHKLAVAWNSGLGDFATVSKAGRAIQKVNNYCGFPLGGVLVPSIHYPGKHDDIWYQKKYDVHYRARLVSALATLTYHRSKPFDIIERCGENIKAVMHGQVTPQQFRQEILQSRMVFSPFGYGEICFRDFESFMYGSCLVKPDIQHLETWPSWYEAGHTYLPVSWDFQNLESVLQLVSKDPDVIKSIASNAYEKFHRYQNDEEGFSLFLDRIRKLLTFD